MIIYTSIVHFLAKKFHEIFSFNTFVNRMTLHGHLCPLNNRRSRRSRLRHSRSTSYFTMKFLRDFVGPAARHFVCSMVKFVCIRVHSWLIVNDLGAA